MAGLPDQITKLAADLQHAWRIHGKICSALDNVKQKPPDLLAALTLAVEMEENLGDLYVQIRGS